jgi:two-component system sensor histidine kinase AlgZ
MSAATTSTPEPLRATAGRVIVALWLAAILYVIALSTVITRGFGGKAVFAEPVVEQVIFLLLWGIATPAIIWSADRWPIDRQRWRHRVLRHVVIATAFIILLNLVGPALAWLVLGRPSAFAVVLRHGVLGLISAFHLALIVYAFILGAGHYLRTLDIRRHEQLRAERLRADLASAQLRALTLQLQPHFLFNALNAVGALIITERNREAFEVVGRLGELLRALLAIEHRDEVSLREELELVEAYVSIEQARLGERLRVTWNVGPDLASAQVPPMLLQPLVENAIRHGIARSSSGGSITIGATKAGTRLALVVADDGPDTPNASARDTTGRAGVGLENTRQRLAHLYGDDQRLDLSRDSGWTRVRVELPFHVLANATPPAAEGAAA